VQEACLPHEALESAPSTRASWDLWFVKVYASIRSVDASKNAARRHDADSATTVSPLLDASSGSDS
jgi:hypothetical protein